MNNDLDRRFLLGAAGLAAFAAASKAGPLNPPAGPVGATGKTTDELWNKVARTDQGMAEARIPISAATTPGDATHQYILSQPGSYYLTGNLTGANGKVCIGLLADGITIDLNGYMLRAASGALAAIRGVSGGVSELIIQNGQLSGWFAAPSISLATSPGVRLLNVTIADSARVHLGATAVVENCTVMDSGDIGLQAGAGSVVRSSLFRECFGVGCQLVSGVIENCAAWENTDTGLLITEGGVVRGSEARGNPTGILVALGGLVVDCSANANGVGITGNSASLIDRCIAFNNTTAGIVVTANSMVSRCVCQGSTAGVGIHVTASDCRVEACNCTDNATGFLGPSAGSIFIANTASSNATNYSIPAGNFGLFVAANAMAGAVNGNSGGTAMGTTDPRANLSY